MNRGRLVLAAALLLAPACSSTPDDEDLYLPTEAEAQAKADQSISEQNADEEFEKLMEEIEEDAGAR